MLNAGDCDICHIHEVVIHVIMQEVVIHVICRRL